MSVGLLSCALLGVLALACDCCSGQRRPSVTAVDEDLSNTELFHRLRQFHGHIGPYAVLGYRLGCWLLERTACGKYFGAHIAVVGPGVTPYTCLLDGLQLSTGHTLGKRNLELVTGASRAPDVLFEIEAIADDGSAPLRASIPASVADLFAEWMAAELSEEGIFDQTLSWPQEDLWHEL